MVKKDTIEDNVTDADLMKIMNQSDKWQVVENINQRLIIVEQEEFGERSDWYNFIHNDCSIFRYKDLRQDSGPKIDYLSVIADASKKTN